MIQNDAHGYPTVLVSDLIAQVGVSPDSVRAAFGSTCAEVPLESVLGWLESRTKPFGNWSAEKANRAKQFRDALLAESERLGEDEKRGIAEGLALTAEVNRLILEQIQSAPAETAPKPFDYRVFAARTGLWLITAAQIALVCYGCFARFGTVGLVVAAIPSVFLVVVNITATDARFWGTTDTGFWVSVALAVVFGTLHFFTFRDLLDLDGSAAGWFCGVSATVVECVALAALSLQGKISNEQ